MAWRDREGWLNVMFCDGGREREIRDEDGNKYGGYEQIWEARGTTCLIGFRRPCISVFSSRIRSSTCRFRNGKSTHTRNSLKSQFLMMLSPISSHLSLSVPSPMNTKLSHPYLSLHAIIMSQHQVQHTPSTAYTEYSVHQVQHTASTAYSEYSILQVKHTLCTAYNAYCIIPKSTVSRYHPVTHLSADHVVLNSLHSHNHKLTNDQSLSSCHTSLPTYLLQTDSLQVLLQAHLDHSLQVHLYTRSIIVSRCVSKLSQLRLPSSLHHSLLEYL